MYSWTKKDAYGNRIADDEKAAANFAEAHVERGVVRWNSNDSVPPEDCLNNFVDAGLISEDAYYASQKTRHAETRTFLNEYRRVNAGRKLTGENLAEARNAFGPDAVIVDAITGQRVA